MIAVRTAKKHASFIAFDTNERIRWDARESRICDEDVARADRIHFGVFVSLACQFCSYRAANLAKTCLSLLSCISIVIPEIVAMPYAASIWWFRSELLATIFDLRRSAPVAYQFNRIGSYFRNPLIEIPGQADQRTFCPHCFPNGNTDCLTFMASDIGGNFHARRPSHMSGSADNVQDLSRMSLKRQRPLPIARLAMG
jgi:hypothetical protein